MPTEDFSTSLVHLFNKYTLTTLSYLALCKEFSMADMLSATLELTVQPGDRQGAK